MENKGVREEMVMSRPELMDDNKQEDEERLLAARLFSSADFS